MKILVCISHVPDTTSKINFTPDNKQFVSAGLTYIINPADEVALARAIELCDGGKGTTTVLTVGDVVVEPTLRKALAIGANDAVRINTVPHDSYIVAKQIAEYVKTQGYDIILCGRESLDFNGSCVPAMIAELLDLPGILFAKKITIEGNTATLEREIDGGREVVEVLMPFVAAAAEGMAEPKIPNMRGIMGARTKPLKVVEPLTCEAMTKLVQFEKPLARTAVKMINPEEAGKLFELLREEKKII